MGEAFLVPGSANGLYSTVQFTIDLVSGNFSNFYTANPGKVTLDKSSGNIYKTSITLDGNYVLSKITLSTTSSSTGIGYDSNGIMQVVIDDSIVVASGNCAIWFHDYELYYVMLRGSSHNVAINITRGETGTVHYTENSKIIFYGVRM